MATPVITLNGSGIVSLTILSWQWIMPNGVQGQAVQATRSDLSRPNPSGSSLVGNVLTQTYTWGSVVWTYDTTVDSQLAITCQINNTDANPITSINFGSLQIQYQGSTNTNFVGATGTATDIWSASDPCSLPTVWNGSSGTGQMTYSVGSQTSYSIDLKISNVYFWGYTFSGAIAESIAAGATCTFTYYLRWMLATDDPIAKDSDIVTSYQTAYPIKFHTNDIRPIGNLFLSGTSNVTSQNLRGWVNNDLGATIANDATTGAALPSGQGNFSYTLSYMVNRALSGLSLMGAQGIIIWDIEGHQYPQGTSYIGMPQELSNMAPEMDGLANWLFNQFSSHGYKTGITLRADVLTVDTPGYGPNSHAVQAPYTSVSQAVSDLLAKAEYAYNRWGCTLFYVDSFGIDKPGSAYDAGVVWQSLVQQMEHDGLPFCMFSSEFSITRSYQYGAPFHQMKNSNFVTPGVWTMAAYPHLQLVNDISDAAITSGHFNLESTLVAAMVAGNVIPMYRAWFQDASFTALQNAITVAKGSGWTGFLTMAPAFVQITTITAFSNPSPTATSITSSAFGSAHTAGNVIVVYLNIFSGSAASDQAIFGPITDLAGNRYKLAGRFIQSATQNQAYLFICTTVAFAAGNTITVPFAINQRNAGIYAVEYTGPAFLDTSASLYSASGTSVNAGVTATMLANETLLGFTQGVIGGLSTPTITGATTRLNSSTNQMAMADAPAATVGSYTFGWTVPSGASWAMTIALSPTAPVVAIPGARPAMGWDSWRLYGTGTGATETNMHAQANALVNLGLAALGYTLFNVNDVLYNGRTSGNLVVNTVKFPSGDTALWNFIKGLGLFPAAYLAPGTGATGCSGFPGSGTFESTDATLIVSQGAKYCMIDNCFAFGTTNGSEQEYLTMVNAINAATTAASVPPIPVVVSDGVSPSTWNGGGNYVWTTTIGATIRSITPDLLTPTTFAKLTQYIDYSINQALWSGPGSINWPGDYLPVANGTLTPAEGRTAMALYCILSYPLWISADLTIIGASDLATLSNAELIAVNQDSLVDGGQLISRTAAGSATIDVWVKRLSNSRFALAFSNRDTASHTISATWSMFGQSGTFAMRDLFAHANLGDQANGYSTTVASHDTAMFLLASSGSFPTTGNVMVDNLYLLKRQRL